jgi:hypothetical protein
MNYLLDFIVDTIKVPRKNYKFDENESLAYTLSDESYKRPNERKKKIGDYSIDYNSEDSVVYKNPNTKEVIVGFRGTNPRNQQDIISDLGIITHTEDYNNRFNNSLKMIKSLQEQNKVKLIAGSSLGGSISRYVSDKTGVPSVTFNSGSSPFLKNKKIKTSKDFIISGDPVSKNIQGAIVLKPSVINPHSLYNYKQFL